MLDLPAEGRSEAGFASDDELLADGADWEALGRLVDARRAAFAAEADQRSEFKAGELGLAFRHGERDGAGLVAKTTRVAIRTAQSRIAIGAHLKPGTSILGDPLPGDLPILAEAVTAGLVGLDAARIIATVLHKIGTRADAASRTAAEADMTASAVLEEAETVRGIAQHWYERLHPDGPEPRDERAHAKRSITIRQPDEDGGSRFFGYLPPRPPRS